MADDATGGTGAGAGADDGDTRLRQRRDEFSLSLIDQTPELFSFIHKMDESMVALFSGPTKILIANPDFLTSSTTNDLQALLSAFRAQAEGGGVVGGEFIGGNVWDDIADFISKVGDFVKDEKKFLLSILLIILGHADCVCKCICE